MSGNHQSVLEIDLTLERREDGGLRVFSEDVPELLLSHRDDSLVIADIVPALETILSAKLQQRVMAHSVRDDLDAENIPMPGPVVEHIKYVVSVGDS